ncbi:hypothetical protein HLB44_27295 [Aquincola sp. S2]|uniref:Protein kinase domain-containing protein n=1 Tax=Pseudaquabacterium terrae TaxID=2732868 RepID=A0ABX2EQA0_9BURK|nr:hypothetical protein [Aquabacterium terrae]NRF70717.1 hypothetical protein [Aquabacterium terrae]
MSRPDPLALPADGGAPPGHRLGCFELQGVARRDADDVVYRAWDHELRIAVAIKEHFPLALARRQADGYVVPLDGRSAEEFRRRLEAFVDEARLLARCDHPSLVRVSHLLRAHRTAYRVMPWHGGRPLLDVRRDMPHPPDEAALRRLLSNLLGALEAFQRIGAVHGGVNPSRILLDNEGRVLLLGPVMHRRSGTGDHVDPPANSLAGSFLAPEQRLAVGERRAGPWTDFFALSRVARFHITRMLPPQVDEPAPEPLAATVEKLYFDTPGVRYGERFLRALDAAASPVIDERPQSAAEFREWLDRGTPRLAVRSASAATAPPDIMPPMPAAAAAADPQPAADAPSDEAAVDPETADLIRRVLDAIPERSGSPPAARAAAASEDGLADPPPKSPRRRRFAGSSLLTAVALLGVLAAIAWQGPRSPAGSAEQLAVALESAGSTPAATVEAPPETAPPGETVAAQAAGPAATKPEAVARTVATTGSSAASAVGPAGSRGSRLTESKVRPAKVAATSPRAVCAERSDFARLRCVEQQCAKARWKHHRQCMRFQMADRAG